MILNRYGTPCGDGDDAKEDGDQSENVFWLLSGPAISDNGDDRPQEFRSKLPVSKRS